MQAVKCPVCNGTGKVDKKECHGCNGKGWVEVQNSYPIYPQPYPWTPWNDYPWYRYPYDTWTSGTTG